MEKLIAKYKGRLVEYQQLVNEAEERGIENLSYEETEEYGVYKGKSEQLEEIITDLKNL
jgi:hypothetical protein